VVLPTPYFILQHNQKAIGAGESSTFSDIIEKHTRENLSKRNTACNFPDTEIDYGGPNQGADDGGDRDIGVGCV